MAWEQTEPYNCCDDAWYDITGYEKKGDVAFGYTECHECGAVCRDVFRKKENWTDYWVGGSGPNHSHYVWESRSSSPYIEDVLWAILEHMREMPEWLPDFEEKPEKHEKAAEQYCNHNHQWVERATWNEGDQYEISYICLDDRCPLKKKEYYVYQRTEMMG